MIWILVQGTSESIIHGGVASQMGCGASAKVGDASQLDSVLAELELFFQK